MVLGLCGDMIQCTLGVMVCLLLFFSCTLCSKWVVLIVWCTIHCTLDVMVHLSLPIYVQLDLLLAFTHFIYSALLICGVDCVVIRFTLRS